MGVLLLQQYRKGRPVKGWLWSEKLDGMRCIWDGIGPRQVVFTDKHSAGGKTTGKQWVTGLWSRLGKPIAAPRWFIDKLPVGLPLDGELWSRDRSLHQILSTVRKKVPGPDWSGIEFWVFDIPLLRATGWPREWFAGMSEMSQTLIENVKLLKGSFDGCGFQLVKHSVLVSDPVGLAGDVYNSGGEGIVIRDPSARWIDGRPATGFKIKPYDTVEGVVVGWNPGEGKYEGMVGSYNVTVDGGTELRVSGFDDLERMLGGDCRIGRRMEVKVRPVNGAFVEPRFQRWL